MNIALIGYGKMGRTIEKIAKDRGNDIVGIVDIASDLKIEDLPEKKTDVAIEFTQPGSAYANLSSCVENGVPVISGTTGWLDQYDNLVNQVEAHSGTFLYSSNFSLGVNLFFKITEQVAKLMSSHSGYGVEMEEIHHTQKKDAPSGTAITLAERIIKNDDRFKSWINELPSQEGTLGISCKRIDDVPGTHTVKYSSAEDSIELRHTAHSRQGFALGAVLVAEWIMDKKGVLTMDDFLGF